jgi:hypothetical protein
MRVTLVVLAAFMSLAMASCASLRSTTIDIDVAGEVRFQSESPSSEIYSSAKLAAGRKHPQQLSPFSPLQAEVAGLQVLVEMSSTVVSVTIKNDAAKVVQLNPSAGVMRSNLTPHDRPLSCANPASLPDQLEDPEAHTKKVTVAPGRSLTLAELLIEERARLAKASAVQLDSGQSWRYFCTGRSYRAIYPSGLVFGFEGNPRGEALAITRSGVGNNFVISIPMVLNGLAGRLVFDLTAIGAKARATYY